MQTAAEIVRNVQQISSLPLTFVRVNKLLEDPECSSKDLARVIEVDQALTIKLLKLSNSAFYGYRAQVDSVARAISIVGFKELKSIVLTISVRNIFAGLGTKSPINVSSFWEHSIATAITCRVLAASKGIQATESYFLAGFLHDIGRMILLETFSDRYGEIYDTAISCERLIDEVEKEMLGFTHAEVGRELLKLWELPANLVEAVSFHHDPSRCQNFLDLASIVHIADVIVHALQFGASGNPFIPKLNKGAWLLSGLQPENLQSVVEQVRAQHQEACTLLIE